MATHSSIGLGGSTADRWLNCAGNYQLILSLPPVAEKPSEYALEGSAMHEVKTILMTARQAGEEDLFKLAEDSIDVNFLDRALTRKHIDTMIWPALHALYDLEEIYGGDFEVVAVERSVDFPGIPGAHGTVDLILSSKTHILHVDWKFGQGVPVKAVYQDPAGDIINAQILFYTAAAMHSAPDFYKGKKQLVGAIIQPRSDTPLSHTVIDRKEIKWFVEDMKNAVVKAMQRDPPLRKGEWCRWCPARIACPLWTAPMLELAQMGERKRTEMVSNQDTDYGVYLAKAKHLVDMLTIFKKGIDEDLHAYLEDGGKVPGWRLKAKTKQRQWIDEADVEEELAELGFKDHEIWQKTLQTFAKTDAVAKRLSVKIPGHLRVAPQSSETTVCRDDDPAPEVNKPLAIEQFRAALAALKTA